jgi:cell division protein FtsB
MAQAAKYSGEFNALWSDSALQDTFFRMRYSASMILLLFALVAATILFISDDGFARLASLEKSLEHQRRTNSRLDGEVQALRQEVQGLQNDPRVIEKAARGELGMARPDELVVVFEKKDAERPQAK